MRTASTHLSRTWRSLCQVLEKSPKPPMKVATEAEEGRVPRLHIRVFSSGVLVWPSAHLRVMSPGSPCSAAPAVPWCCLQISSSVKGAFLLWMFQQRRLTDMSPVNWSPSSPISWTSSQSPSEGRSTPVFLEGTSQLQLLHTCPLVAEQF